MFELQISASTAQGCAQVCAYTESEVLIGIVMASTDKPIIKNNFLHFVRGSAF